MTRRTDWRIDVGSLPLLLVPLLSIFPLRNNDLWFHLAAGRWMVRNRAFPDLDPFSHTEFMGRWVDNEWLAELLFYGAWTIAENAGLILLRAVLFTTVFLLLRAYLRSARRPSMTLPAMVIGIAISYSWWALRPSVFSLIGMLTLMILLERIRHGRREAWLLPCLFLVWANLHPGFLFGLLVLAATAASLWIEPVLSRARRFSGDKQLRVRLSVWCAVSAAVTLVNPYGVQVFSQQFVIAQNVAYRKLLDEWAPPSVPFLLLVLIAVGAFLLLRYRRVSLPSLVPILGAALLSMTAVRFEEYFALVAVPAMLAGLGRRSRYLCGLRSLWRSGRSALAFAVTGVLLAGALLFLRPLPADGVEPERYPDACLAAIPDDCRLFNKLSWGGWLIWKRDLRTYIDGRCWGQPIFFEYLQARSAEGQEILTQRRIDTVILPPFDPLIETLAVSEHWYEVCRDDMSVVYRLDSAL